MENHETFDKWRNRIGNLGEPLPKLQKAEKQQMRSFLRTDKARGLEDSWKLRLSLAAGLTWSLRGIDLGRVKNALTTADLIRFIDKLCEQDEFIDGKAGLDWLGQGLNPVNAGPALAALLRLSRGKTARKARSARSVARLSTQTAIQVLRVTLRAATTIFRSDPIEPRRKRNPVRRNRLKQTLEIVSVVVNQYETAQVSGTALEIMSLLGKSLSSSEQEKSFETEEAAFSRVVALPAKLIREILSRGCLEDADFLSSRVKLIEQAELQFIRAIEDALKDTETRLSPMARQWAEATLGYKPPPSLSESRIDSESDVSLERMATLLLAAWDAKDDGAKAQQLFVLFAGICKTAFRMNLSGEVGSSLVFEAVFHESGEKSILRGERVRLLRPWVEWQEGGVRRVIVRGLVAPLGDRTGKDPGEFGR
jgi:hypothetical protein